MFSLITAASDSAAFRLARLFNDKQFIFGSIEQMPNISGTQFIKIPSTKSPSFAHELLTICLDNNIHEIYPLFKDEIIELTNAMVLFQEFEIKIVIPSINYINFKLLNTVNNSSKLIVMLDGKMIAGELPPYNCLTIKEENGVFQWEIINDEVKFNLFSV